MKPNFAVKYAYSKYMSWSGLDGLNQPSSSKMHYNAKNEFVNGMWQLRIQRKWSYRHRVILLNGRLIDVLGEERVEVVAVLDVDEDVRRRGERRRPFVLRFGRKFQRLGVVHKWRHAI